MAEYSSVNYPGPQGSGSRYEEGSGSESDDLHSRNTKKYWGLGFAIVLLCLLIGGSVLYLYDWWHPLRSGPEERSLERGTSIPFPECSTDAGPFIFKKVSRTDPLARAAVDHLITQTKAIVKECDPPMSVDIAGDAEANMTGNSAKHSVTVSWKYARDCKSVTFQVKFISGVAQGGWLGQVNWHIDGETWTALPEGYRPSACEIGSSGADAAQVVKNPNEDAEIMEAAAFAVAEINNFRKTEACQTQDVVLVSVNKASEQLSDSHGMAMELVVNVTETTQVLACVTVFVRYLESENPMTFATGLFGEGDYGLCSSPPDSWGAAATSSIGRRLSSMGLGSKEDQAADPTQRLSLHRRHYWASESDARRLADSDVKPPISLRYINVGNVPGDYDPQLDEVVAACINMFPVYDQGSCGCCYAAAMAQMFGLRKCFLDAKTQKAQELAGRIDYRRLGGKNFNRSRLLQNQDACNNDPAWADPNGNGCEYYTQDVRRCADPDVGQRSHCELACHTCPNKPSVYAADPAMEKYLYSTQDVATCSCNSVDEAAGNDLSKNCEEVAGCEGGSMWAVWDNWMRMANRRLRRRQCNPLTIKCLASKGVTNPLSGGHCDLYANTPTWNKPCSCINRDLIPDKLPACSHSEDDCTTLSSPVMIFQLMTSVHGITKAETVLNIQRHILEAGPVYATFTLTEAFHNFFSSSGRGSKGDVFATTDPNEVGGHAVITTGWGTTTRDQNLGVAAGKTYWKIRNSWTSNWGIGGYARVLAGINLMDIEKRLSVAMMSDHEDFSPPVCQLRSTSMKYQYFQLDKGLQLCKLEGSFDIVCSEEAVAEIAWGRAEGLEVGTQNQEHKVYRTPKYSCPGWPSSCKISGFDLLMAGYGLQEAALYVRTNAYDRRGNIYAVSQSLTMSPIEGAIKVGGQQDCGLPKVHCENCVGAPWTKPGPAPAPPPAPLWVNPRSGQTPAPNQQPEEETPDGKLSYQEYPSRGGSQGSPGPGKKDVMQVCFPPNAAVRLADGSLGTAGSLRAGDSLLDPAGTETLFIQDFHAGNAGQTTLMKYLRIEHDLQAKGRPLLVTENHLVALSRAAEGSVAYVPAGMLRPGDAVLARTGSGQVEASTVLAVSEEYIEGYAAPLSASGVLWVEDVLVSSYALLTDRQMNLWRSGPEVFRTHTQEICHLLAFPFRLFHKVTEALWALAGLLPAELVPQAKSGPASQTRDAYLALLSGVFDSLSGALA